VVELLDESCFHGIIDSKDFGVSKVILNLVTLDVLAFIEVLVQLGTDNVAMILT